MLMDHGSRVCHFERCILHQASLLWGLQGRMLLKIGDAIVDNSEWAGEMWSDLTFEIRLASRTLYFNLRRC